jgi:hypothetical protein
VATQLLVNFWLTCAEWMLNLKHGSKLNRSLVELVQVQLQLQSVCFLLEPKVPTNSFCKHTIFVSELVKKASEFGEISTVCDSKNTVSGVGVKCNFCKNVADIQLLVAPLSINARVVTY